jgi:hypothetical protein
MYRYLPWASENWYIENIYVDYYHGNELTSCMLAGTIRTNLGLTTTSVPVRNLEHPHRWELLFYKIQREPIVLSWFFLGETGRDDQNIKSSFSAVLVNIMMTILGGLFW